MTLLTDKVVVVTGAGGGIGEAIAKLAATEGASVVVNDLGGNPHGEGSDSSPAERVAGEIRASGGKAIASFHSIATWETANAIIEESIEAFGRIDAVVNNAGILRNRPFHEMSEEDWTLVRSVNLDGYYHVSRAAAPFFRAQGGGSFVHVASTSGLIGNVEQANYAAAKLGVVGLSKSIALDMAAFNVRSNCVAPFAFTRMVGTIEATDEATRRRLEFSKRMTPDKVAPLVCALISDQASDINGQIFAARMNELLLFSQSRPVRTVQSSDGWTPDGVLTYAFPALRPDFHALDVSSSVFTWTPF